jgi:O-antigen/teichoic acid export membrane protein
VLAVSDRIVLGKLADLREVGLYAVAASVVSVLTFLNSPLGEAWGPHAVQAFERDPEGARSFYGRVLTYVLLGFGFLSVAVTAFGPELLDLLTTSEFSGASVAIAPLALGAVAYATIQVTAAPISLRHKTVYIGLVTIAGAALNVALNVILVPHYGMRASAWVTAGCALFLTASYAAISHRLWRIGYESRRVAAIAVATVVFTLVAARLPDLSLAVAVPAKIAFCLAYLVALVSLGGLDRREGRAARVLLRGLVPRRS